MLAPCAGGAAQPVLPFSGMRGWLDAMDGSSSVNDVLAQLGPPLKRDRTKRDVTVTELLTATGAVGVQ